MILGKTSNFQIRIYRFRRQVHHQFQVEAEANKLPVSLPLVVVELLFTAAAMEMMIGKRI